MLLSDYASSRDNNFNLIRFVAAFLVLFSHSFALVIGNADAEPLKSSLNMTWGSIAVDIFFITSGFLITASYFSRANIVAFAWARFLRIYPALIVAVVFCVFVIGLCFTKHEVNDYLTNIQTYKYLIKNSVLIFGIEYRLPGVFLNTPYGEAVNGSLWTLPYEVKMYGLLALVFLASTYINKIIKFITAERSICFIALLAFIAHIYSYFTEVTPRVRS